MALFKRKEPDPIGALPPFGLKKPTQWGDEEPRNLWEFAAMVESLPQHLTAGEDSGGLGGREYAFQSEFGRDYNNDRDGSTRTLRGRTFSRYYAHRLRIEYPILQTATGANIVNAYSSALAGLRTRIINENGEEQRKPDWMRTPMPGNPSFTFRKLIYGIVYSVLIDGNAFVLVQRDESENIIGLRLLDPTACHPFGDYANPTFAVWDGGSFATLGVWAGYSPSPPNYRTKMPAPKSYAGHYTTHNMLHIATNTPPEALRGCSPFMLADSAITTQIYNQEFIERQFAEGSHKQMIASFKETSRARGPHMKPMTEEEYAVFQDALEQALVGQSRFALIPEPMDYKDMGWSPQENEMTEARIHGRDEIGISGRTPPLVAMNNREGAVSYASSGAQMALFASQSLDPMRRDLEDEFSRLCGRGCHFEMDIRDLLKGDNRTEAEVDRMNLEMGLYSVDAIRKEKGQEPYNLPWTKYPTFNAGRVLADGTTPGTPTTNPPEQENES